MNRPLLAASVAAVSIGVMPAAMQAKPLAGPDLVPPVTAIAITPNKPNGLNGWYVTAPTLTVSASDGGGAVAETRCVLDPASPPASFDQLPTGCHFLTGAPVTSQGQHVLYAASRDVAGNREAPSGLAFKADFHGPDVNVSVLPRMLAPVDQRLVPVQASLIVSDAVSGPAGFVLASVTSSQPDSGLGPDDLPGDIQGWSTGTPDVSGLLRAEALGRRSRTYTIAYRATDQAGNATTRSTPVLVPWVFLPGA
jgi:hypothetical protein